MPSVNEVVLTGNEAGETSDIPPTFLERWGVLFLAWAGGWILLVGLALLAYYLCTVPRVPVIESSATPDQVRDILAAHRQVVEEWRDSVGAIFDLLVTKTVLPIVTLLLGYLFGKTKTAS
jgi:hypothetical protein